MDEEDENTLTRSHRHAVSASASTSLQDWSSAITSHRLASLGFESCYNSVASEEKEIRSALELLYQYHSAQAVLIETRLKEAEEKNKILATQTTREKQLQQQQYQHARRGSTIQQHPSPAQIGPRAQRIFTSPPSVTIATPPPPPQHHPSPRNNSSTATPLTTGPLFLSPDAKRITPTFTPAALIPATLSIPFQSVSTKSIATGTQPVSTPSNTNNSGVDLLSLITIFLSSDLMSVTDGSYARVQSCLQDLAALIEQLRTSATPAALHHASDEQRTLNELKLKLSVGEQLAAFLNSQSATGLTSYQLTNFSTQFQVLLKQHTIIARESIEYRQSLQRCLAIINGMTGKIGEKVGQVETMLKTAAEQARTRSGSGSVGGENVPSGTNTTAAAQPTTTPSNSSDTESQLKSLLAERDRLNRALAEERAARHKAEKHLAKHEERWKQLNEKVAAKKQQAAAATSGATSPSSGSSDPSIPKPAPISSASRSSSGSSSLHVAKPVQVNTPK